MGLFSNPLKTAKKLTKRPNLKNPTDPLGLAGKGGKRGNSSGAKGTGQNARMMDREERGDQSQAMSKLGQRPGGLNFRKTAINRATPAMSTGGNTPPQVVPGRRPRTGGNTPPQVAPNGNTGIVGPRKPMISRPASGLAPMVRPTTRPRRPI